MDGYTAARICGLVERKVIILCLLGKWIATGIHGVAKCLFSISQLLILLMMVSTCYDVIMRYAFARPTSWSVSVNAMALAFITFFAGAELVRRDQHLKMELVAARVPRMIRPYVELSINLLAFLFVVLLTWIGATTWQTVYLTGMRSSDELHLFLWIVYLAIPVGSLFMALEYLVRIFELAARKFTHEAGERI
jgi:TRAP-type C4-dicarboxylate transport system permease small subunit